jgi:hypothetical protein
VERDVKRGRGGVSGTPTFFINGCRHHGAYDIATLTAAAKARARAAAVPLSPWPPRTPVSTGTAVRRSAAATSRGWTTSCR